MALTDIVDSVLDYFEQNSTQTEEIGRRTVTLPGGTEAEIIDLNYSYEGPTIRSTTVITVTDTAVYSNENAMVPESYTDEFDAIATQIAVSLLVPAH